MLSALLLAHLAFTPQLCLPPSDCYTYQVYYGAADSVKRQELKWRPRKMIDLFLDSRQDRAYWIYELYRDRKLFAVITPTVNEAGYWDLYLGYDRFHSKWDDLEAAKGEAVRLAAGDVQ